MGSQVLESQTQSYPGEHAGVSSRKERVAFVASVSQKINLVLYHESVFLRDCALDDIYLLCSRCFHATDHTDHNVSFFIAQHPGSCCECGDPEVWRGPLNCPQHPPALDPDAMIGVSFQTIPKVAQRSVPDDGFPQIKNYPYRVFVPPELRETMSKTVAYALDFLLDTLDFSPDEPFVPANEADLRLQPSADPMMKDQFCVLVWNDDKHSIHEVIQLVCDSTTKSREDATDIVHRIDENGREVIDMSTHVARLLEVAQTISQIDLGVTIRRAYDTFREQVAAVLVEWLLDLTRARLSTDTLVLRELIAAELLSPRKRESPPYNAQANAFMDDISNPTRLDWMLLYHTRLWKRPRLSLKEVLSSILTLSYDHKLAIGSFRIFIYDRLTHKYLQLGISRKCIIV
jgi:E3 ubiquitin-protein ligase UBR1